MSVFPLQIPEKINTPELQAFFQQFGFDKYLSAEEINKIVAALEELKEAQTKTPSISNANSYISSPTTALQVLSILEIPANTFANDDIINFKAFFTKLTDLASCNITIWKNTTPSLTGASIFYKHFDVVYAYVKILTFDHKIGIIKNNTLIISTEKGSGDSYNFIDTKSNNNEITIDFNVATTNYLIATCQLNNAADVVKQEAILIEKIN